MLVATRTECPSPPERQVVESRLKREAHAPVARSVPHPNGAGMGKASQPRYSLRTSSVYEQHIARSEGGMSGLRHCTHRKISAQFLLISDSIECELRLN